MDEYPERKRPDRAARLKMREQLRNGEVME